jgi:hypothetical protein
MQRRLAENVENVESVESDSVSVSESKLLLSGALPKHEYEELETAFLQEGRADSADSADSEDVSIGIGIRNQS